MPKSRIYILVHDLTGQPIEAIVEGRSAKQRRFSRLEYHKNLQRYVAGVEPGPYAIRVKGPDGTAEEAREIEAAVGDNHVSIMVAKPGLPALRTPQGNWYFEARKNERLLHVSGPEARKLTLDTLERAGIESKPVESAGSVRDDDVLFQVPLGRSSAAQLKKLEHAAAELLPEHGLTARIAIPGYVGKELAFGLTDEIIIRFQSEATTEQIERLAERHSLKLMRHIAWMGNGFLFRHPETASLELLDVVDELSKDPLVVHAEVNLMNKLENFAYTPADYLYPETPHLPLINADDAWDSIQTQTTVNRGGSPDVVVAVLDLDGVDPTHPELTGTLSDGSTKQIANFNFVAMANQTFAGCPGDHGTQCAGSATGRFDNTIGTAGVAPNCKLIGGRFSGFASDLEIADIWVWMAGFPTGSTAPGFPAQLTQGADIISNSWGPSFKSPNQTLRDAFDFLSTYPRAGRGVIMAFATGNYGYSLVDTRNPFPADAKTLGIGASINTNPTNPVTSAQPDHQGNTNNLPAVVDTRSYISPYGMTVDLVSPSHTCYGVGLPGAGIVDPIMASSRTGLGDWPANPVTTTTLTSAVAAGATTLPVASVAGFAVGARVVLSAPGSANAEVAQISGVGPGNQLSVGAIGNAHPAGTTVATGPNDFAKNVMVGFGGTSHSCPTVAGAAALLLSVKPDLNWVEVRDILRGTAVQIDAGQTFATGQWLDLDGDSVNDFSQWYGYGRLDVGAAVNTAITLTQRTDAVMRDNLSDTGAVPSTGWHASSPDIWVRRNNDAIPALGYGSAPPHQNPSFGQDNYVFMRVRNNGTAAASVIYLRALITHFAAIEFQYPDDWQPTPRFGSAPTLPLQPGTYLIGEATVNNLAAGADTIVKLTWDQSLVPPETVTVGGSTVHWHPCLLAEAAPHDGPAVITGLAYPVKGDNNIAHRNITIDYPSMGGSLGAMSGIVAGTRSADGVDALVVDLNAVPAGVSLVLKTPHRSVMKHWVDLIRSGKGVKGADPLGAPAPRDPGGKDLTERDLPDGCGVTLLTKARLAVRCCNDEILVIDAPEGTRLRTLCAESRPKLTAETVSVGEHQGDTVIRIRHGAGAVALPLRLAANEWAPIFVGADPANETEALRGRIYVSQLRADGEVSAGYEIEI